MTNCIRICRGCVEGGREASKGYIFISLERETKEISTELLISKTETGLRISGVKHHVLYKLNK